MKKCLSLLMAAVMLFAVCVPAFAAGDMTISKGDANQSASSDVFTKTTRKDNTDAASYSVTIPAETEIAWGETRTVFTYHVKSQLEIGNRLHITAVSENGTQELKNAETSKTLPYAFSYTNLAGSVENLNYTTDNEVIDTNRTFNIDITDTAWQAVPIAEYADRLTFTVEVVGASVSP